MSTIGRKGRTVFERPQAFSLENLAGDPQEPARSFKYKGRGNLVALVRDGTAVLGLGDIGALAA